MRQGAVPPTEGGGGGGTGRPSTEMAAQSSLAAQRSGDVQPRVVAWRSASSHTAESGAAQGSARAAPSSRMAAAAAARRWRGIGVGTLEREAECVWGGGRGGSGWTLGSARS